MARKESCVFYTPKPKSKLQVLILRAVDPRTLKGSSLSFCRQPDQGICASSLLGWEWIRAIAKSDAGWAVPESLSAKGLKIIFAHVQTSLRNVSFCFVPWHKPSYSGIPTPHRLSNRVYQIGKSVVFAKRREL